MELTIFILLIVIFLLVPTWVVLFFLARNYVKEDIFKDYIGGNNAIYGGFRLFQYKYYRDDKLWACTVLRIVLVGILAVVAIMSILVPS
mgnify:CR=1 FL=1